MVSYRPNSDPHSAYLILQHLVAVFQCMPASSGLDCAQHQLAQAAPGLHTVIIRVGPPMPTLPCFPFPVHASTLKTLKSGSGNELATWNRTLSRVSRNVLHLYAVSSFRLCALEIDSSLRTISVSNVRKHKCSGVIADLSSTK